MSDARAAMEWLTGWNGGVRPYVELEDDRLAVFMSHEHDVRICRAFDDDSNDPDHRTWLVLTGPAEVHECIGVFEGLQLLGVGDEEAEDLHEIVDRLLDEIAGAAYSAASRFVSALNFEPTDADDARLHTSALAALISSVSEECWSAGWLMGAEFDVWRLCTEGGAWGMLTAEQLPELAGIRAYAEHIGWWFSDYEEPIRMEQWLPMYAAWRETGRR